MNWIAKHTETALKYQTAEVLALLRSAGYTTMRNLVDPVERGPGR